jgi:hypothetical protein
VVHDGQSADNAAIAHARGGPSPPSDTAAPGAGVSRRPKARAWRDKGAATAARVKTGPVGSVLVPAQRRRLDEQCRDVCRAVPGLLFPVPGVVDAATGRSTGQTITDRLGLNAQAGHDVDALISAGNQTVSTLSVLGAIVLVLFAVGIPGILQAWYQKVYDQPAPHGGAGRQLARKLVWVAGLLGYLWLQALVGQQTGPAGGHLLTFVCEFAISLLFWWGTVHFLAPPRRTGWRRRSGGRSRWRRGSWSAAVRPASAG